MHVHVHVLKKDPYLCDARHDINEIWVVFTGVIAAARNPGNEASLRFMMEICGRVRDILDCVAV